MGKAKADNGKAKRLITVAEAARRLGLNDRAKEPERCVREMARRGDLVARKVGCWTQIVEESVDQFIGDMQQ